MLRTIARVPGMHDRLPGTEERFRKLVQTVVGTFARWGYKAIDVPVLEPAQLFMLKSGEEIVSRLFAFEFRNRQLCLRPEITASVIRAYLEHLSDVPLPVRLCYSGPVFRNEPLDGAEHRQFTQIGVELLGARGPAGDAEVIQLALDAMSELGLTPLKLVLGHMGVIYAYLATLDLEERLRTIILWHLEDLRNLGTEAVRQRVATLAGLNHESSGPPKGLLGHGMEESQLRHILGSLLGELDVDLTGSNRSPEDIVARLAERLLRPAQLPLLERALDFLSKLIKLAGPREEAMPAARMLLIQAGVDTTALDELDEILDALDTEGVPELVIDFGMSRGFQYYTGPVFELIGPLEGRPHRIGGGGRYDGLVGVLGGDFSTAACGFAFNGERLFALADGSEALRLTPRRCISLIPASPRYRAGALKLAKKLRAVFPGAEVVTCTETGRFGLEEAQRLGCSLKLLLEATEGQSEKVTVHTSDGSAYTVTAFDELFNLLRKEVP